MSGINKKDPAVVEHVSNEVTKAVAKAVKAETARCLGHIKNHAEANKGETDKAVRTGVANAYKSVVTAIKAPVEA